MILLDLDRIAIKHKLKKNQNSIDWILLVLCDLTSE